jgi:DNA end-binding protein Ku
VHSTTYALHHRPMAPTLWKGALALGLVNIPVELRTAVRRMETMYFRQLEKQSLKPIGQGRVSSVDGKPIPWSEIMEGYELADGKCVVMTDADFETVSTKMTRTLELTDVVPGASVDSRYYDQPYFLVQQQGGEQAYALVLELIRFEAELVHPSELSFPMSDSVNVRPQERRMAIPLIENLSDAFDPSKYRDAYTEQLRTIITAKAKGRKLGMRSAVEPDCTNVVDLVSRLEASLAASGAKKRSAAKKSTRTPPVGATGRRRSA